MMKNNLRIRFFFLIVLALCAAIPALADEQPQERSLKVGLALSGGGARGAAHIGVLKVLEREGVPVDYIAGVSMGALVGGLYSVGYSPVEIEKFLVDQNWNEIFSDAPQWRFTPLAERAASRYQGRVVLRGWNIEIPGGLLGGQRFIEALDVLTAEPMLRAQNDFDRLPVPFRAVATNLINGEPYVFSRGSMTQALRASTAVPMMFTPLEIEDALLVDGGLVNNLPTDIVRDMGADIIIAIDVSTPLSGREDLRTIFSVVDQSISLQVVKSVEANKKLASIVLSPDLSAYPNSSYGKLLEIVKLGEETAERHIDEIRLLVADIPARRYSPSTAAAAVAPIIDSISFHGLDRVPLKQVEKNLRLRPGDVAEPAAIAAEVGRIYAMRLFESVGYTLEPAGENHYRLIFRVQEDLLHTIGAGIRYDNDYSFTVLSEFVARQIFRTPSRAVVSSQFGGLEYHTASFRYVPFQMGLFYVEPKGEISSQKRRNWGDATKMYRFSDKRMAAQIIAGGTLTRQVELSAGYRIERVRISDAPEYYLNQVTNLAGVIAQLDWNSLDSPEYPRSGRQFSAKFERRGTVFGSDSRNIKGTLEYRRYVPLSDNGTLRMELVAGYSEGYLLFYDTFFAGGYSQSSRASEQFLGFGTDEISARQMGIVGLSYSHRIFTRPLGMMKQGYLTTAYNSGSFSEQRIAPYNFKNLNGFGAGLALDTRVGPLRMTFGWGEGGRTNFYVSFGPSF